MNGEIISIDRLDEHEKLIRENGYLRTERNKLKDKIDKAIEYTTQNTEYLDIEKGEMFECEGYKSNRVPIISVSGLLDILRGEDNE